MKPGCNVATLIERYFTERLMRQRNVSANTIASYRDAFRLLFDARHVREVGADLRHPVEPRHVVPRHPGLTGPAC